ncbi:adenylate kinase 9-like isoform X4 [Anneissia japonica]|uniref:adenylate kinase 9-like isoform X4 n=1 Tax=Anneissia japonica TaxID=1529436 RepID=UPI0014256AEB|nr:adenylate kinase 9-like isoform X4 [Anneissia japonica]
MDTITMNMAEVDEEISMMEPVTPSVTIDITETRPATHALLDSEETPDIVEADATHVLDMSSSRALSETSVIDTQATISEIMRLMESDPFDADQAELRFLHSKPTCFIVLGKPGAGKTTLANKLAQTWHCQLLHATDLILLHIELQTETGIKMQEILLKGEALPEAMVAKMIEDKINSPEVAHHGYVLDGFPSLSEDYMTIPDQLELVKNWNLKPDFIINIKIPDNDLYERRVNQRVDSLTGNIYTKEVWSPEKSDTSQVIKDGDEDEEGEEEEDEEEEEEAEPIEEEGEIDAVPELSFEILERLVRRPEDLAAYVTANIKSYKNGMLRLYEDYMADHDQQYLIELDGNKTPGTLFKDLMLKLNTFTLRRAAVPIRLQNTEEEEIPEDVETEELMRTLASTEMVAPRYRWRRSRWARACPVELQKGNVIMGKPEYAVGFLDKIYVMSGPEAFEKFLKNPRPYLIGPQPRPPCKLSVVGPPLAGKTSISHLLAQKFNARVLDVTELIKPRMKAHKEKQIQLATEEAKENAISSVKSKLREEREANVFESSDEQPDPNEAAQDEQSDDPTAAEQLARVKAREESEAAEAEAEEERYKLTTDTEGEKTPREGDEEKDTDTDEKNEDRVVEKEDEDEEDKVDDSATVKGSIAPTEPASGVTESEYNKPDSLDPEVNESHPEVQAAIEAAIVEAESQVYSLAPEQYVDAIEEAINEVHKELKRKDQNGPGAGGWVLDNFPQTRDQWNVLIDRGLAPDEVIMLKDTSEGGVSLLKRWYKLNKEEVDMKARIRQEEEEAEKNRVLEDARLQDERRKIEEEERRLAEIEERRQKRIEDGEDPEDIGTDGEGDTEQEQEQEQEGGQEEDDVVTAESKTAPSAEAESSTLSVEGEAEEEEHVDVPKEDPLPPEGPETQRFKDLRADFDREWPSIQGMLTGMVNIEPIAIDIEVKKEEDILKEAVTAVESPFTYRPWEYTSIDMDEDDEDAEAEDDDEMEEEEDEEVAKNKRKPYGDTKHFCPVSYAEKYVLWPGNPEIAAKYREQIWYFSNSEERDKFLAKPTAYVAKSKPFKPPPVRLFMLGPRGAGKSLHGRALAKKLGIFHISFKDRLQELIIAKTKKKVGPEYEEEEEEPDSDVEDGIQGPDGEGVDGSGKPKGAKEEQEAEGGEEEEQEVELTEEEENIKAYLIDDETLPHETLEKIISPWWNEEPFMSTGFILEGFPHSADEANYLAERGLFPDLAVSLIVEDTDIQSRLLPPKLKKWKERRDRRLAKKERRKARKKKERDAAINKRKLELQTEMADKKAERLAQRAAERDSDESEGSDEDMDDDDEEDDDIEALLAEEFEEEEEEEEEDEELEEDAIDRLKNEIGEMYDEDTNRLVSLQENLEELMVPRIDINAGRKPHIVRYTLEQNLKPVIDYRPSLFERVYPIKESVAKKMLEVGYKHPSRFGRWCPVKTMEGDCIQPMQGPGFTTYPVIYRQHIYFLSSIRAREQFIVNPLKFLKQPSPKPVVPIKMAIIGPPKCGKTTLANRFVSEYGMLRLSMGEALRFVLDKQPATELAKKLNSHLRQGKVVPDELAVQALEVSLTNMRCHTRGYILDGYPLTKRQVDLMTEMNIIPVVVLELEVDSREVMVWGMKDRYSPDRSLPLHDSAQILAIRIASWQKEITAVREWYKEQHRNWVMVNGQQSKWKVWEMAKAEAHRSVRQIQTYLQRLSEGKAASIADMCITPKECLARLGIFQQYCPVSLANKGELVDCSTNPTLEFTAEFRGRYYKMENAEKLAEFLENPEKYVPPLAPRKLPPSEMLPRRRTAMDAKSMFPIQIELQGYCPVTFLDGKLRYEAIVPGNPELIVEYRGNLYCFVTEEKLQKFLRTPEKYYNLKLPHKLPPKQDPLLVTSLPMLGYMEQTLSTAITKSLTAVGCFKPKYPFVSASRSALLYVAYHLKAYNPKSSEYVRKKFKKKLMQFEEQCELIRYLGDNMTLKYRDPGTRPIDFDHKMNTFLNLRGTEPTPTWLM